MRKETRRKSLEVKAKYLISEHERVSDALIKLQIARSQIEGEFEDIQKALKGLDEKVNSQAGEDLAGV